MVATQKPNLYIRDLDDEAVVLNAANNEASSLNNVARTIFEQCDGKTSISTMVNTLDSAGLGPATEDTVWLALSDLANAELVELKTDVPESASRRTMLKKLALGAAAGVALLPIVETIAAPPAYAQGSMPGPPMVPAPPVIQDQ